MFGSISTAIVALMTSLTTFAGAFNKLAQTADNLATVAEETSGQYMDEARIKRQQQLKLLEAQ